MAISDAQYTAWLAADNKLRVVLAEVQAYSGGSTVTRYLSNRGYVSAPTDTPANTAYDDILVSIPSITSALADAMRGRSLISFGDLEIDNSAGDRDSWLTDAWDGRPVNLYLGDEAWDKADFRQVFGGTAADIQARDNSTLTLRLRDKQSLLDVPMQTTFVGGTGSALFQRVPICYGEVKFAEPVLIDSAARRYQLHDGQIQSIDAVWEDGAAVAGADFTANLANGTFVMNRAVVGRLTVDLKGSKTGGTYVNTTADIAQRIITERSSITAGEISAAAVTALNVAAPGVVGVYVTQDHRTVLSVLDELITGAGGYYSIGRDGVVSMALFTAPSGTPVVTIIDDDIEVAGIDLVRRIVPKKSIRIGYARYQTMVDTTGLAGLTEAVRQRMADEYLIVRATTALTGYLLAVDADIEYSAYAVSADASTEATRRAALWGVLRRVFRIRGFMAAGRVQLGDVIALDLSRYGLAGGVLARVIRLRESLTGGSIELEVFL